MFLAENQRFEVLYVIRARAEVARPSQLVQFFLGFVPFAPLLWVHQSYLAETFLAGLILHTYILSTSVMKFIKKANTWPAS